MVITLNIYVFACVAASSLTCGTQHLCVMQDLFLWLVLSSCGVPAEQPCGMWDLSSPTKDRTHILLPCKTDS